MCNIGLSDRTILPERSHQRKEVHKSDSFKLSPCEPLHYSSYAAKTLINYFFKERT